MVQLAPRLEVLDIDSVNGAVKKLDTDTAFPNFKDLRLRRMFHCNTPPVEYEPLLKMLRPTMERLMLHSAQEPPKDYLEQLLSDVRQRCRQLQSVRVVYSWCRRWHDTTPLASGALAELLATYGAQLRHMVSDVINFDVCLPHVPMCAACPQRTGGVH